MAKYSINDTTLTAIGDAVRDKSGKHTRIEPRPQEVWILKSPNVNSFEDVVNYDTTQRTGSEGPDPLTASFTISGATKITVKVAINNYLFGTTTVRYKIGIPGETHWRFVAYSEDVNGQINTYEIPGDIVNIELQNIALTGKRNSFYFEVRGYDEDGNLIKDENVLVPTEVLNTLTPAQMAEEIEAFKTIPEEAFTITGDCNYRFANNGWNWLLKNFGDKITTENISRMDYMFQYTNAIEQIPFDININSDCKEFTYAFYQTNIREVPNIYGTLSNPTSTYSGVLKMPSMFAYCKYLREVPDTFFDNLVGNPDIWEVSSNYTGSDFQGMFNSCYSLRKLPDMKKFIVKQSAYYNNIYGSLSYLSSLDEVVNLPLYTEVAWTSNAFSNKINGLTRIKNFTCEVNEDGSPKTVSWKSQTLDLTSQCGYAGGTSRNITAYNSGITEDKEVKDDATYQALKDDPDWFTNSIDYSRYNHDSAVATINSLPDASAYLASAGGTNTIKFKGGSGALTDGGAINTLTEEEIAVAAAKGWTVTLV